MKKSLEKLLKILDENFIDYDVLNNGQHVKMKDDDGLIWNYYPSSQKFHTSDLSVKGKGLNDLLKFLKLNNFSEAVIEVSLGVSINKLSKYQSIVKVRSGCDIKIPVNCPFSIIDLDGHISKISIPTDTHLILRFIGNGEFILTSTSGMSFVNIGLSEETL